jgi:hypothetical protein
MDTIPISICLKYRRLLIHRWKIGPQLFPMLLTPVTEVKGASPVKRSNFVR